MDQPELHEEIVERAYDLAVDPARFVDFFEVWDKHVIDDLVNDEERSDLGYSKKYNSHFLRASVFLDQWRAHNRDEQASLLDSFGSVGAFAVNNKFLLIELNGVANDQFSLKVGDELSALAISDDDVGFLKQQIMRRWAQKDETAAVYLFYIEPLKRNVIVQFRAVVSERRGEFAVIATSELGWPSGLNKVLAQAFNLTDAEISISRGIVECKSLKEIAEKRGRSLATVRTQLRTILAKTEMHTQAELVRMVLGLFEVVEDFDRPSKTDAHAVREPNFDGKCIVKTIVRPGNRKLDYFLLGDPRGTPVLYFPLDLGFARLPASVEAEAKRRGLRIIVPIRPGFGKSTKLDKNADIVEEICQDIGAVLVAENAGVCPAISFGSDTFFAFAFNQMFPERLNALIGCAGILPMNRAEQYERMDAWFRYSMMNAKFAPRVVPFLMKAGFFLAQRIGKDSFFKMLFGGCPADLKLYEVDEVRHAIRLGTNVALTDDFTAHEAFAREILAEASSDWSTSVDEAKGNLAVHILSGSQDPLMRQETIEEFKTQYQWIEFQQFDDTGKFVLFQHAPAIFDLLERYLSPN